MDIQSNLIHLRQTTEQDLDFVMDAEQADDNRRYIAQWKREQHMAAFADEDVLHFIILNADGERSGYVILTGMLDLNLTVCIMRLVIVSKGHGYGSEALRLLIGWIFNHTETHRLWLDVRDQNTRAQRIYQRQGFRLEGTLRECIKIGDTFESLQIMSILRPEYEGRT
ncbi:acetyltransferase [Bacillus sp. FJAT-27264]|uniref:GNAT family N-acetyltransferase n=1 Tax=Paenibacillus sp. (strain DSM 101736 / FJAT-27264) TaxID=1850362 RepID=UPI0008080EDF|nr:GNAT family N-acetyltransferase [Bacillus sp. FJAT-27264]OBZ08465.1 acetyltransferase [Bacillus sp. FJAT-27264]